MQLLDANIFLRALVRPQSDPERAMAEKSIALFQRLAAGTDEATTIEAIIGSVCYVLRSRRHYGLEPAEIAARLRPLLVLRGLKLPHKGTYLRALDLWATYPRLDFDDVLLVAHSERLAGAGIASFDTDFDSVAGAKRIQP